VTVLENREATAGVLSGPATTATAEPDPRSPRRRLEQLLDPGSVELISVEDRSGFLAATGLVAGAPVVVFATDATVMGGAMGVDGCRVVLEAYERALADRVPVIGVWHSGGARLAEGVASLHAVGEIFAIMTRASGRVPQISLVLGPAAGGAAYGPALTDVVVLGPEGRVFVTGPDVVRSVTGEDVDMLRLGGPEPHGRRSGVVHVITDSTEDAFRQTRRLAKLLGDQGRLDAAAVTDVDLGRLLPDSPRRAYDVHPLVEELLDPESSVELHPRWAASIVTTLGRLGGRTVGVIANNPLRLGGCLDAASAEKASRFVRMCDAFGVPLVVLVDVPGYLPGVGQEWDGVVRRGAKLLHAFAEATVPRVSVVTRKAYGGAFIAMNSRALGASRVFAWPTAEVAVMGAVAAVRILHRRRLAEVPPESREQVELELAAEHEKLSGGLQRAIDMDVVDEMIDPARTRSAVARAITEAPQVHGRHGNIPL
jgi:acetyl-CoA/propionyl-CoA carboxylase carboxyl transferase subunit